MRRAIKRRLARLEHRLAPPGRDRRIERRALRVMVELCDLIRAAAATSGIAPAALAEVEAMRLGSIHELESYRESPALRARDEAAEAADAEWNDAADPDTAEPRGRLAAESKRLEKRYRNGAPPPPDAPLLHWLAWGWGQASRANAGPGERKRLEPAGARRYNRPHTRTGGSGQ
jgi:hypothetical protein